MQRSTTLDCPYDFIPTDEMIATEVTEEVHGHGRDWTEQFMVFGVEDYFDEDQ
jgi:hypothetical protein